MAVSAYRKNIQNSSKSDMTIFYLEAVGTGITWTNSAFSAQLGSGLFCAPNKFKLTGELASNLINKLLKNASAYGIKENDSISYVLLVALANSYPCR